MERSMCDMRHLDHTVDKTNNLNPDHFNRKSSRKYLHGDFNGLAYSAK